MSELQPVDVLCKLLQFFHDEVEKIRPGARYVITCTDELLFIAFCDHGGDLRNDTTRLSSGPLRPHPANPGWKPPTFQRVRIRVQGGTGDVENLVPPILWLPGPGRHVNGEQPALPSDRPDVIDI